MYCPLYFLSFELKIWGIRWSSWWNNEHHNGTSLGCCLSWRHLIWETRCQDVGCFIFVCIFLSKWTCPINVWGFVWYFLFNINANCIIENELYLVWHQRGSATTLFQWDLTVRSNRGHCETVVFSQCTKFQKDSIQCEHPLTQISSRVSADDGI